MENGAQAIPQQMQRLAGSYAPSLLMQHDLNGWRPISTAPIGCELQLSVIEDGEEHSLVFPCHRTTSGWRNCQTEKFVTLHPTHWRHWGETAQ